MAQKQSIDWDLLIAVGVPLFSTNSPGSAVDGKSVNWKNIATATMKAIRHTLSEREEIALRSWMVALRDHYVTTFNRHFSDPIFTVFMTSKKIDGRHIKLRRIAANSLSRVA
jgi:hypothetical protein